MGAFIDIHEKLAVDFLAIKLGYDITFLVPNRHKSAKTPDIEMAGVAWEIKSGVVEGVIGWWFKSNVIIDETLTNNPPLRDDLCQAKPDVYDRPVVGAWM